jgi:hypothetical protein
VTNEDVVRGDQQAIIGESDHEQHRAAPGEGIRAPLTSEGADHAEFSVFDGHGNESVVVVAEDEEGRTAEGTGTDSASAAADARRPGDRLGGAF